MKLVFATRNPGKLRELEEIVDLEGLELLGLADLPGVPEVEETGATFAENAAAKAEAVMRACGLPTLADDSGLEVDALGGAPGVRSARYAGPGASDAQRIEKLLGALRDVPEARRTARFRCVVALADPRRPGAIELREGSCEGRILEAPRGAGGFGYDPVFFAPELGQTFAEAPAAAKHRVSHRGRAMQKMCELLRERLRG